jgi:hypothetical protein
MPLNGGQYENEKTFCSHYAEITFRNLTSNRVGVYVNEGYLLVYFQSVVYGSSSKVDSANTVGRCFPNEYYQESKIQIEPHASYILKVPVQLNAYENYLNFYFTDGRIGTLHFKKENGELFYKQTEE